MRKDHESCTAQLVRVWDCAAHTFEDTNGFHVKSVGMLGHRRGGLHFCRTQVTNESNERDHGPDKTYLRNSNLESKIKMNLTCLLGKEKVGLPWPPR